MKENHQILSKLKEMKMTNQQHQTDILIIGAGPAGLFSIFEAGMLQMKTIVVDSLDFIGGQCTALYPEKPIYDIPALPEIKAEDLIKNLEKQASPFKPFFLLGQSVVSLEKDPENVGFILTTSKQNVIKANSVIIAAGSGAFGPNRPPIESIESFEGKSVFYMVRSREDFRDKKIVIAGGGDSAVDWALSLCEIAKSVTVVHRRPKFRCAPENSSKLAKLAAEGKINLEIPYQLHSLRGHEGQISHVILQEIDGGEKEIEADILLPFFGLAMELGPIANWGLEINKKHISVTAHNMQTNIEGIFAIGDMANYEGKLKLILNGFAESATACHSIYKRVKGKELHFEYSTTKGIQ